MIGRRSSWLVAGIFGGLVAGALAALMASLFTFVFVWAFVFSRFPSAERLMSTAPVVVGAAVLLGVFAASVLLANAAALRAEERAAAGPSATARENQRATAALAIAVFAVLASVGLVALSKGWIERRDAILRRQGERKEEERRTFERERFVVAALEARPRHGGHDVTVTLNGRRAGDYRLSVAVRENLYHKELFRYEERLHLDRGERSLELSIDDALLADTYRERVLSGPAGTVWVKESFTLEAALVPEEQADVTGVMPLAVSRPLPVDFRVDWPGTLVR